MKFFFPFWSSVTMRDKKEAAYPYSGYAVPLQTSYQSVKLICICFVNSKNTKSVFRHVAVNLLITLRRNVALDSI